MFFYDENSCNRYVDDGDNFDDDDDGKTIIFITIAVITVNIFCNKIIFYLTNLLLYGFNVY